MKEMIMVGNMQRKIVGLLLIAFMVPFYMQGMDIMSITSENTVVGGSFVVGLGASVGIAALFSDAQKHVVPIFAAGALAGICSYRFLREYTPGQIVVRALEVDYEITNNSRIGSLLSGKTEITSRFC
jgi:hypothetical protein